LVLFFRKEHSSFLWSTQTQGDAGPEVISDWPEDIAHLALLMVFGKGWRMPSPRMMFELLDLPLFDSEQLSGCPHNARFDAMALRDYAIARMADH